LTGFPGSYYRDLARRLNAWLETAAFEERRRLNDQINAFLAIPEPEKSNEPKRPVCHEFEGRGIVFSADRTSLEPCTCATPEFAAEFRAKEEARRNRAIQTAAAKENATGAAQMPSAAPESEGNHVSIEII
jgi:hypothetical protein